MFFTNRRYADFTLFILPLIAAIVLTVFELSYRTGNIEQVLNIPIISISLVTLISSFVFVPISSWLANKLGVVDKPAARKIHLKTTPLMGGVAIYISTMISLIIFVGVADKRVAGLLLGSSMIFVLSLLDDWKNLSAKVRLVFQILASLIVIYYGEVRLSIIPNSWPLTVELEVIITVLWLIGVTNAVNFLDGSDGVVGGLTIVSSISFFAIGMMTGQKDLAMICLIMAIAPVGFLFFNLPPAKIFLGDAGSCFIGFTLAALAVMGEWASNSPMVAFSVPLMILGIPVFDICYTTVTRVKSGKVKTFREWLEYVGKDHFHHRLLAHGFTVRNTALVLFILNMILGLGAVCMNAANDTTITGKSIAILLFGQAFLVFLLISALMEVRVSKVSESDIFVDMHEDKKEKECTQNSGALK